MKTFYLTDSGKVRDHNEDSVTILKNAAEAKRYSVAGKLKELQKDFLVEYHVLAELYVNIFRVIGYAILAIVSIFSNTATFNFLLILMALMIYIYYRLIMSVENEDIQK